MPIKAFEAAEGKVQKIFLVNDKAQLNRVYRTHLIDALIDSGLEVESIGLFECRLCVFLTYAKLLLSWRTPFVSSNLRANIICMTLIGKRGLIILNGLGRVRQSWLARQLFLKLIKVTYGKVIALQCYADYRYLKRYAQNIELHWIPGSGGNAKEFGRSSGLLAVQRDNKIQLTAPSLLELIDSTKISGNRKLAIVGCDDAELVAKTFDGFEVDNIGTVPQADILLYGSIFVQPDGYGEGFPHTLADALVSEMPVLISSALKLRLGLYVMGVCGSEEHTGWHRLEPPYKLDATIGIAAVTAAYAKLTTSLLQRA